jgi:hypothetical protein
VDGYLTWQLSFAGFLNIPVFIDARIIIEFLHVCGDSSDIFKRTKSDPSLLVGLEDRSEGVINLFVPELELNWYSFNGLSSFIQCENYISKGLILLQIQSEDLIFRPLMQFKGKVIGIKESLS